MVYKWPENNIPSTFGTSLFFYKFTILWSPYVDHIYFHAVISIYLSFFPRLISAAGDWMSTILPHMVWP